MYEVIDFSRGSGPSKVAAAIADELKVKARTIQSVESLPEESILFLCSGPYLLRPSRLVRDFIRNNDFQGRKVALFGGSIIGVEVLGIERLLKQKGAIIIGKSPVAGKFFFSPQRKPSDKELIRVRQFARSVMRINKDQYKVPDWLENLLVIAPWRTTIVMK